MTELMEKLEEAILRLNMIEKKLDKLTETTSGGSDG